jgi:diguanylate cyclase (GGDEF)-like protein
VSDEEASERQSVEDVVGPVRALIAQLTRSSALERGDVAGALRQLTESSSLALRVERSSVWQFNDSLSELTCVDLYSRSDHTHRAGSRLSASAAPDYFRALTQERSIAAHDARNDPRTREFAAHYLGEHGISSMLDAPILLEGRLVGVVCHEHVGETRRFKAWEELIAGTFADFAAMVLGAAARARQAQDLLDIQQRLWEQKQVESELRELATTDALTGALNRRRMFEIAEAELANAHPVTRPLALAMLDIDHFKAVNDRFGHVVGDEALQRVAHTVRSALRRHDHVARYGGEELAVLLPGTTLDAACKVVERIRSEVAALRLHGNGELVPLSLSAGVVAALAGESLRGLIQRADGALYRAKTRGRNRVVASG